MKKIIIALIVISAVFFSCKKDPAPPVADTTPYMSYSPNSTWNYTVTNNVTATFLDYTITSTNKDTTLNGKTYHVYTNSTGQALPGSLTGAGLSSTTAVNLSTEGSSDWAHWSGYDHKATGGSKISNFTMVGTGAAANYINDLRTCSWDDGTPTVSGSNQSGVYVAGIGNGFQLTVPADLSSRTLKIYVGGYLSGGTLTAQLSDGSSADYVNNSISGTGQYSAVYTLTYNAASAGKLLTVKWVQSSGTGNVTLQAATLVQSGPVVNDLNEYYNLTGNDYYTFRKLPTSLGGSPVENIYLKYNVAIGTSWNQSYDINASGVPLTVKIINTITNIGSLTVNSIAYTDVIHVTTTLQVSAYGVPLPAGAVTTDIQSYYARKFGLVQSKNKVVVNYAGINQTVDEQTILKSADIK